MRKQNVFGMVSSLILCAAAVGVRGEDAEPTTPNRNPINVVAVGYDIGSNARAQQMLEDIAEAAREGGAQAEVILADQSDEQLEQAMEQAMAIATSASATGLRLELVTPTVRPGEKIVVRHSDVPVDDVHAWIAFYQNKDDPDQDYLHYTFLRNLTDRVFDVMAPAMPGDEYHFRVFPTEAYEAAARSEAVTVR